MFNIPKILHFVWIGDESKCPHNCINTWRELNPNFEIKIWGNREYHNHFWHNKEAMDRMWHRQLCGVADMMRYEILYNYGGFCLDADSTCVNPLEDWLFDTEAFAVWENEHVRPGLIAVGYMASIPKNQFFKNIIDEIHQDPDITAALAWIKTGPDRLTKNWKKQHYPLTIWPSHLFMPNHFDNYQYNGHGKIFGTQMWGSTNYIYDDLHKHTSSVVDDLHKQTSSVINPDIQKLFDIAKNSYNSQDWLTCYQSSDQMLRLNITLLNNRLWEIYDLAAISAYYLGIYDKAKTYGSEAVKLRTKDQRLLNNLKFYMEK